MDAFEKRIQFIEILKRLTSSQQSIAKVVAFAIKNAPRCGDDLWDCLVEECQKAPLNAKINIFYALDGLMEASLESGTLVYLNMLKRDLAQVVDIVTPPTREGILNLMSTKQILKSWKLRRILEASLIEPVEETLENRPAQIPPPSENAPAKSSGFANFSRNDVLRRIEDDRERQKRLREKIWILPQPASFEPYLKPAIFSFLSASTSKATSESPFSPESPLPNRPDEPRPAMDRNVDPIAIEFDQLWQSEQALLRQDIASQGTTKRAGLTSEDWESMRTEDARCFGAIET